MPGPFFFYIYYYLFGPFGVVGFKNRKGRSKRENKKKKNIYIIYIYIYIIIIIVLPFARLILFPCIVEARCCLLKTTFIYRDRRQFRSQQQLALPSTIYIYVYTHFQDAEYILLSIVGRHSTLARPIYIKKYHRNCPE